MESMVERDASHLNTLSLYAEIMDRMAREIELTAARMVYANAPHRIYIDDDRLKIAPIKAEDYWLSDMPKK